MRTLARHLLQKHPALTALLVFTTLIVSLLEGIGVGLLIPIVEQIGRQPGEQVHRVSQLLGRAFAVVGLPFNLFTTLVAGLILFVILQAFMYERAQLAAVMRKQIVVELRTEAFENLLRADVAYLNRQKSGHLVNAAINESARAGTAIISLAEILTFACVVTMYFVVVLFISWPLTLIAICLLGGVSLALQASLKETRRIGERIIISNKGLYASAIEYLSGVRVVQAFGSEGFFSRRFRERAVEVDGMIWRMQRTGDRITFLYEVVLFGILVTVIYIAVTVLQMSQAVIVTFLFILYRLSPKVVMINRLRQQVAGLLPGFNEVQRLISETKRPAIVSGRTRFGRLEGAIKFEHVRFGYSKQTSVLHDLTITIERGHTTAIVGPSGGGKSTFLDLLLRAYDPVEGRILADDVDLRDLELASWRRAVAVVHQDIFLFNDTVQNNLLIGNLEASEAEVRKAAELAHAHEFVALLPEGYNTVIGDRGVTLSGGQRQRLALARAFLRSPQILVLDEPTSALDPPSEALIWDSLTTFGRDKTIVTVAHRLSLAERADKIIVLEGGRAVEVGSHANLIADGSRYASLHPPRA